MALAALVHRLLLLAPKCAEEISHRRVRPGGTVLVPAGISIGVIVHIIGDMMTTSGCNLVHPFILRLPKAIGAIPVINWMWKKNGHFAVPVLMTTGGCNLVHPFILRPPKAIGAIPVINWMWKKNGYFAVPVLGNAGSIREWCLLVPISAYAIGGVGWAITSMGRTGLQTLAAATGLG